MSSDFTRKEVESQPQVWRLAAEVAKTEESFQAMPKDGQRVAIIGCGTSWFMAQSYAALREDAGKGETDAFTATEFPTERKYDHLIFLSRSGTTTEIIELAAKTQTPSVLITAVADGPARPYVDFEVVLDFADEESVVQTRFATSALLYMRASLGFSVESAIADCERAIQQDVPMVAVDAEQISFLGTRWTYGLAKEAALKMRESSQSWTEAYPAMEYRHGPIAIAQPGRCTWIFGPVPEGMDEQIANTGATMVTSDLDPLAHLVLLHRVAVARCDKLGINADVPRNLTRSVILPSEI